MTMCGKTFSFNIEIEKLYNIDNKIEKLRKKLNMWKARSLTPIGKILIVKTFGISQLIYFMQSSTFTKENLDYVDKLITDFVSNGKRPKIKMEILKNSYELGGLNSSDIEC